MRIAVTGATGHPGRWFIDRLIREKFEGEIVCLVRSGSDISQIEQSGLRYRLVYGSLGGVPDRQEIYENFLDGADIFMHIAGIQYSKELLTAAIKKKVGWAVLVHTTGRYSKYKSASAEYIKIEDEILSWRDKIGITIIRPTMIYGSVMDVNMHKLISYFNKHKFFPLFGDGHNLMQPVHSRDLGNAFYEVIEKRATTFNKNYNLSGLKPQTYYDIIQTVCKSMGKKIVIIKIPIWLSVLAAQIYNLVFGKRAIISVEQVLRMQEDKNFSYEDAARDFGYQPISFEEGIREEIRSMGIEVRS